MIAHAVTVEEVQAAVGTLAGAAVLVGLCVRYALLPWLQTHIVVPVREVTRQVSYNGHRSEVPTLLDRVDTAAGLAAELRETVDQAAEATLDNGTAVRALGRMLDGHLNRSAGEWGRLWAAIETLQAEVAALQTPSTTDAGEPAESRT